MIDLLVAGGGPAGLAAAIFGAQAGLRIAVVEPHTGAIDKACGEGIMPVGLHLLADMGVALNAGRPFLGVRYHRNGISAEGRFRSGPGRGVRRTDLSHAMWRRAADLGVERIQGRVRQVELFEHSVRAAGLEARWLVAADGLHSTVRRSLGVPLVPDRPGRFGIRRHFRTTRDSQFVEVYLGDAEEAYVTPVADGLVGVAILASQPRSIEEALARFPRLAEHLIQPVGSTQGAGPFRRFASTVSVRRVALVGDAAGFLDPITGEGVRLAFESARLAVDCIVRGSLAGYEEGWRVIMRRYRTLTSALLLLRRTPLVREAIVPTLRIAPFVFDKMLALLGDPSPRRDR